MPGALAVRARGRFFSTFSVAYPRQTSAPASLPVPPPTTLVGALSASHAALAKSPEVVVTEGSLASRSVELLRWVRYAALALDEGRAVPFQDLMRYLMLPYQHRTGPRYWFGASAFGRVSAPLGFSVVYIVDEERADYVSKLAWGLVRLGSKESLVEVDDVRVLEVVESGRRGAATAYYTPARLASCREGCAEVYMWPLSPDAYTRKGAGLEKWLVPYSPYGSYGGVMRVDVVGDGVVLDLEGEELVVPRSVLTGGGGA